MHPNPASWGLVSMRTADVLFAHWAFPPDVVAERLPDCVDVATEDDEAWLGIVAFEVPEAALRGLPFRRSFGEVNLRTYVERDGDVGVYFFDVDVSDPLVASLGRLASGLPTHRAEIDVRREDGEVRLTARRTDPRAPPAHFDVTYGPVGEERTAEADSLESFLLENHFLVTDALGGCYRAEVRRRSWPIFDAQVDLHSSTVMDAAGFDRPGSKPLVHYSPGVELRATPLRRA